ncbi:MAG: heparan-alpha-glucosaminide N-acetyltransferase [Candidatus Peribacteraceae bacterium]|nr:heparan-alpha-glucosaminide N-acetyltransferase [Candidatus Peribacteraceae bacterium]
MSRLPLSQRHLEIDLLRTIALVLMIVYHTAFDLAFFYQFPLDPQAGNWLLLQRVTANLFLVTVGVSFAISYSRMSVHGARFRTMLAKYVRRAIGLLACGMLISAVTALFLGATWVRFGILHLIGMAILLLPFLMPLREGNALLALAILFGSRMLKTLTVETSLLLPLGLAPASFASVDYFPVFPWLAPVLLGAAAGNLLYNRNLLRFHLPSTKAAHLLTAPGRFSLRIYLIQQPVLLAGLWLIL